MKLIKFFGATVAFITLAACGGGGGGSADAGTTTTPVTATQIQFGNGTFGNAKFSQ